MEVYNINDDMRKMLKNSLKSISSVVSKSDEKQKTDDYLKKLFLNCKQKNLFSRYLVGSLFVSFYLQLQENRGIPTVKNTLDTISKFESVDDIIDYMDFEMFKFLYSAGNNFDSFDIIKKRKNLTKIMLNKDYLLNISPLLILDLVKYFKINNTSDIIHYYNYNLKKGNNKIFSLNETASVAINHLLLEQKYNEPRYYKILKNIIDDFYKYNKYLLLTNKTKNEQIKSIINLIEEDNILHSLLINENLFSFVIKGFILYNTLPIEKRSEIDNYFNNYYINYYSDDSSIKIQNPNNEIRKYLDDNYYDDERFKNLEDNLKNKKNFFDKVTKVLYLDKINNLAIASATFYEKEKSEYNEMLNFKNIEEFKSKLKDDYLYDCIRLSVDEFNLNLLDKKNNQMVYLYDKLYNKYLVNNYLYDYLETSTNYTLRDMIRIYNKNYDGFGNEELALTYASEELMSDITNLEYLDKENYDSIIYNIVRIYYEYNKFLISKSKKIGADDKIIINKIDKDFETFIKELEFDAQLIEKLIIGVLKYNISSSLMKGQINLYIKKSNKNGNLKLIKKKNKNS